jgi:hypothetical protein
LANRLLSGPAAFPPLLNHRAGLPAGVLRYIVILEVRDGFVSRHKRHLLLLILLFLLFAALVISAPRFLLYSSSYEKTDAIVLFLGPDFTARQKEAYRIINEEKADYLIIPAYHKIYKFFSKGDIRYIPSKESQPALKNKARLTTPSLNFYEDTHLETIEAKKMMAYQGLSSAIFVSSPYHMRRIKIIVGKVFNLEQGKYHFVPTSFEKASAEFWELSWVEWRKIAKEYGKIIWFQIYSLWTN